MNEQIRLSHVTGTLDAGALFGARVRVSLAQAVLHVPRTVVARLVQHHLAAHACKLTALASDGAGAVSLSLAGRTTLKRVPFPFEADALLATSPEGLLSVHLAQVRFLGSGLARLLGDVEAQLCAKLRASLQPVPGITHAQGRCIAEIDLTALAASRGHAIPRLRGLTADASGLRIELGEPD